MWKIKELFIAKPKYGEVRLSGNQNEADAIIAAFWSAKQILELQEACYAYGDRYELLQQELADKVRDERDAMRAVADASAAKLAVQIRLQEHHARETMENW